ncbi:hypothetical protein GCM10010182_67180 [Actinomadura cremea]|nr:hypothetical protein GCM10010182_67180 [Actinomadura cremea]
MTETKTLAEAVAMLQTRLPEIKKDQKADVVTQKGSYSYSYADLAQVTRELLPILGELGLSFISKPTVVEGRFVLVYRLLHVSGESEDGEYPLPSNGTPQAVGSAITYARRYCLCAVTGVAPEDDDGAAAQAASRSRDERQSNWRVPAADRADGGDGAASKPQLQKLHVLFSQVGWTDKADRLRATVAIVGRELASATELSRQEASKVIDALDEVARQEDPAERLTELVAAKRADTAEHEAGAS